MPNIPKAQAGNLVLVGSFNPRIVSPTWLLTKGLVAKEWFEVASKNLIITQEFSSMDFYEFQIQVTVDRFTISTSMPTEFDTMKDMGVGIFSVLNETPITQLGLNFSGHYQIIDERVPENLLDAFSNERSLGELCNDPVLTSISFEGKNDWQEKGKLRTTIQPSLHFANSVFVDINNHFENDGVFEWKQMISEKWAEIRDKSIEKIKKAVELVE
jgi:hypothetical protein